MLCRIVMLNRKKKTGTVPVYLNVYDLTTINGYAYWVGLGVYHSGVQVHGVEYGFGAHDHETTGIFEVEPKQCPGFMFRKSILIGRTDLGPKEVRVFMEKLAQEYPGNTYNLITKNCNHFCDDVCFKLTGKSIPQWVNRLARLELNQTKIRQVRSEESVREGVKKKLRSRSTGSISSSNPVNTLPSLTSCPSSSESRRGRQKRSIPVSPKSLVHDESPPSTRSLKA